MPNVTVYFATNRLPVPGAAPPQAFGAEIGPATDPNAITYATAFVQGIDLAQEGSGTIASIDNRATGGFPPGVADDMLGGRNLLLFLHGFDNAFSDAITCAAYNHEWFAASGIAAADTTVVAFTWPSLGALIAPLPSLPADDYRRDQRFAGLSAFHIATFLGTIRPLLARATAARRRCFLLAHSMGNYALAGAVETWFAQGGPAARLFDEVFLAAADEQADSFAAPAGQRLSRLPELCDRVSLYSSRRDIAMDLSTAVNGDQRLGFDGPVNKADTTAFPPARFRIGDATEVDDFDPLTPQDATHQYYRRSATVRADIARTMAGSPDPAGGVFTLPTTRGGMQAVIDIELETTRRGRASK